MDPQHNSAHNKPVRHNSEHSHAAKVTSHMLLTRVLEEVLEFNHSYTDTILERQIQERFPLEEPNENAPLEKELYTSELIAEKKEAFEQLLVRNQKYLHPLGLSLSMLTHPDSASNFSDGEASFHLDNGARFIEHLESYRGKPVLEKNLLALVTIFEDLFSYIQYHGDLTRPDDERSIEFAASLRGLLEALKNLPEFQYAPTLSILARYQSFLERRCLHEVIMVERASIFEIGSLRLNDAGTEFIHIPFSNPSLRWHIICNNSKSYANVWQSSLRVLEMLLLRPDMKQLTELALTTTLGNLHWIKQDLNSNGWSLRDDGESEEFKIVVDEIAEKVTAMLHTVNLPIPPETSI